MKRIALISLLMVPLMTVAAEPRQDPSAIKAKGEQLLTYREAQAMSTDTFLNSHLDLKYLLLGRKAYLAGDFKKAMQELDRSAYYGEKLAQAMIAEMYWNGEGVNADRARAYAMSDVAAERMTEPFLVSLRERYWDAMTARERSDAVGMSEEILARYSDKATFPRLEQMLRNSQDSHRVKGYGRMLTKMIAINADGSAEEDIWPDAFFAQKFWDPKEYVTFKDKYVGAAIRHGTVKVKFGGKQEDEVQGKSK